MTRRTMTRSPVDGTEREMVFGWDVIGTVAGLVVAGFAAWLSLVVKVNNNETMSEERYRNLPVVIKEAVRDHDEGQDYLKRSDYMKDHHTSEGATR